MKHGSIRITIKEDECITLVTTTVKGTDKCKLGCVFYKVGRADKACAAPMCSCYAENRNDNINGYYVIGKE